MLSGRLAIIGMGGLVMFVSMLLRKMISQGNWENDSYNSEQIKLGVKLWVF